jgi:hypothetical protein
VVAVRGRNKFHAKAVEVDGIRFDSKAEAKRWFDLRTLEMNGLIAGLERQKRYDLEINGVKLGFYKADFRYFDRERGVEVVEDVKGVRTPVYALKAKLMRALHGVTISEYPPKRGRAP